jgi:lipoic acid synthetase
MAMGFRHAACGPLVRSSYHADQQANTLIRGRTSEAP